MKEIKIYVEIDNDFYAEKTIEVEDNTPACVLDEMAEDFLTELVGYGWYDANEEDEKN